MTTKLNTIPSPSLHTDGQSANLSHEDIRELYENMLRDEALKDYTFPTKPSSDGYYHVYVADSTKRQEGGLLKQRPWMA